MRVLKVFDAGNYAGLTEVIEKNVVRGVIFIDGKMAMQCSGDGEYKIPGGGVEPDEDYIVALEREVQEETGLLIIPESCRELGMTIEKRRDIFDKTKIFVRKTFFYLCEVKPEMVPLHMTQSEIAKGFHSVWETPEKIYMTNKSMPRESWDERDTEFVRMLLQQEVLVEETKKVWYN